jgi:predicted dehydrogenase
MERKLRWGVLGAARIATVKVIPGMQRGRFCEVVALASRDATKGAEAARALGIPRVHGSYEALLDDPDVDAVYNPLPNHLHVPWSIRALEAGKHVLCEKPVGLTVAEVEELVRARDRTGRQAQEAFMVRTHPQWLGVRDLIRSGRIGALRAVSTFFSYFNDDPANVRNVAAYGGGGLYDIGCYPITLSRFLFEAEPRRVAGCLDRDPRFGTDRLASGVLEFEAGHSIFTCSTQAVPYQRLQAVGTRVFVDDGRDVFGGGIETLTYPTCDQYTIQGDLFSQAILEGRPAPVLLEDAIGNARVIAAVLRSGESGRWETP